MPVQKFPPMRKDFPSFDCDAHVAEPNAIWERAGEYLTKDEMAALKSTMWFDKESNQLIVNGVLGAGIRSSEGQGRAGSMN